MKRARGVAAAFNWFWHSPSARRSFGAFGIVMAFGISSCEPQCAPPAPAPPAPAPAPAPTRPPAGAQFFENFASSSSVNRFVVRLHSGADAGIVHPLVDQWQGDHNLHCAGPETKRTVVGGAVSRINPRSLTWHCAPNGSGTGHLMTSVDTDGVALLSFSPNQSFNNIRKVCWEVNATNLGEGKWVNMAVIPETDYQRNGGRLDYTSDPGLDASALRLPSQSLMIKDLRGAIIGLWNGYNQTMWEGGPADITDDVAARFQRCVEDRGNGTMRVTVERPNGQTQSWDRPGGFPDGRVRVLFQDGTYNPDKHNPPAGGPKLTWHWDEILIQ